MHPPHSRENLHRPPSAKKRLTRVKLNQTCHLAMGAPHYSCRSPTVQANHLGTSLLHPGFSNHLLRTGWMKEIQVFVLCGKSYWAADMVGSPRLCHCRLMMKMATELSWFLVLPTATATIMILGQLD
ncbi:hypothetical protein EX30DRAFT_82448 [Ascodesmis nigricans]|uniref:Uncharacterized protein n=1 Tax=Ascodesmis nigricans TaxID=341454 RepID=A0A4S2N2U9_9PEZI|nr:hypothetical protein EX30DRAFT_82448 [Ascodesmis nigricans]